MKTVHRAASPIFNVRRLEEIHQTLQAEITANTVVDPPGKNKWIDPRRHLPETVTYPTKAIENILWQLVTMELELRCWSTPVDQRGKLDKSFSLR